MELWADVKGYEGLYQVSNLGDIRSLDRYVSNNKGKRLSPGKLMTKQKDRAGYLYVHFSVGGKGKNIKIHRLVAEAFCHKNDDSDIVNHIDGIKENNVAENLEWCTAKENTGHSIRTGLWKNIGENASSNVLKEWEVLEIRNNHLDSYDGLAEKYGVTKSTIADIKKFRSWKHIGGDRIMSVSSKEKENFPEIIKAIRESKGLNKGAFAKELGVSRSAVDRWERALIFPGDKTLRMLSETLGVSFSS